MVFLEFLQRLALPGHKDFSLSWPFGEREAKQYHDAKKDFPHGAKTYCALFWTASLVIGICIFIALSRSFKSSRDLDLLRKIRAVLITLLSLALFVLQCCALFGKNGNLLVVLVSLVVLLLAVWDFISAWNIVHFVPRQGVWATVAQLPGYADSVVFLAIDLGLLLFFM